MYEECHREENKEHCGAKIENITASVSTVMETCKELLNGKAGLLIILKLKNLSNFR